MPSEVFPPTERNIGQECEFWQGVQRDRTKKMGYLAVGCKFPKFEIEGRLSCEGIIDDVCLYVKNGILVKSLNKQTVEEVRNRDRSAGNRGLPPGNAR